MNGLQDGLQFLITKTGSTLVAENPTFNGSQARDRSSLIVP
jgi:hypothetical protein